MWRIPTTERRGMVTDEQLARIAQAYDTQMALALRRALKTRDTPRADGRRK